MYANVETRPGLDEIKFHRFNQMEFFNRFITFLIYTAKANEYPFVKLLQADLLLAFSVLFPSVST